MVREPLAHLWVQIIRHTSPASMECKKIQLMQTSMKLWMNILLQCRCRQYYRKLSAWFELGPLVLNHLHGTGILGLAHVLWRVLLKKDCPLLWDNAFGMLSFLRGCNIFVWLGPIPPASKHQSELMCGGRIPSHFLSMGL